ncbi:MAG: 5'-nucleotidase C-terminal domain-containing protein [bacterium]
MLKNKFQVPDVLGSLITYRLPLTALLLFLCGCARTHSIVIFCTGDIHGKFRPEPGSGGEAYGGIAVLKRAVDLEKTPHLLLDAGNWFHGTAEGWITGGKTAVELMNAAGYAAAALGRTEFSIARKELDSLLAKADFAVLSSNVHETRRGAKAFPAAPYAIRDTGGYKVGIFALTSPGTPRLNLSENTAGLRFAQGMEEAKEAVKALRKKGAAVVVALCDSCFYGEKGEKTEEISPQKLAREVSGIDVIIGSHSHKLSVRAVKSGKTKTWIISTGSGLLYAGRLEIKINAFSGRVHSLKADRILLDKAVYGEDRRLLKLADSLSERSSKKLDRRIGRASVELESSPSGESRLGNWAADCLRTWGRTDAALMGPGMPGGKISEGPVSLRVIYGIVPSDDSVMFVKLRGDDLQAVMQNGLEKGGLQISGLKVFLSGTEEKEKVEEVLIAGHVPAQAKIYKLAVPDSLAGAEGLETLSNVVEFANTRRPVREILAWCAGRQKVIADPGLGRWVRKQP